MSKPETGEAGFPGYKWTEGLAELWVSGAKEIIGALNDVWDEASFGDQPYTFGRWTRDIAKIWLRSFRTAEKLAKYPIITAVGGAPVWIPIVASKGSDTAASRWVDLPKTLPAQDLDVTGLERLGKGTDEIPEEYVHPEINDMRDRLYVWLSDLYKLRASAPAGTYVGFVKLKGASGPPLAVLFVSLEE